MNASFLRRANRPVVAAAFSALLLVPLAANAWGPGGHMIVAQIAYDKISAEDSTAKSSDFVYAAHWADDVRTLADFKSTAGEHFIDNPFSDDGTALPGDFPEADNIVVALQKYVAVLQSSDADDATRAQALRFVIHFVGDVHQPLHCATRVSAGNLEGDRGGNQVTIKHTVGTRHPTVNLHSYWDGGLDSFPKSGANFAPPPLSQIPPAAAAIQSTLTLDAKWQQGGPYNYGDWAKESSDIADTFVYQGITAGQLPSDDYVTKGQQIAQYRVLTAGYRLATLLEAIWPNLAKRSDHHLIGL